jgi:hypothetical protein
MNAAVDLVVPEGIPVIARELLGRRIVSSRLPSAVANVKLVLVLRE